MSTDGDLEGFTLDKIDVDKVLLCTVCPVVIVSYYTKWVTTSWTYSTCNKMLDSHSGLETSSLF